MNAQKLFKVVKRILLDSNYRFLLMASEGMYDYLSDEEYLKRKYRAIFGVELNLNNPKTFNEKLQWLKLYERKDIYTIMVDKYEAKKYVANLLGEEYIIPTLGVWNTFDEINFDKMPNQFVLKCTHDSGGLVVVKDKTQLDIRTVRKKINRCLKNNYFYLGREWPYKNIQPRIIAEQYMTDNGSELSDYKFMCFNGKVKCSFVCSDRYSEKGLHVTFFDRDWNVLPFERHYPSVKEGFIKPLNYEKMIEAAEILSRDIPFVRVDFYEVSGKIYFGELTFYPGSGYEEFTPSDWDVELGSWIKLPIIESE